MRIPVGRLLVLGLVSGFGAVLYKFTRPAAPRPAVPAGTPDPFPFRAIPRPEPVRAAPTLSVVDDVTWIASEDGSCPLTHPVKANAQSRIFHVPGGLSYDRTKAERCYRTPLDAEADGFRAAKR